jgi:hypothetical protein
VKRSFTLIEAVVAAAVIAAGALPLLCAAAQMLRTQQAYRAGRTYVRESEDTYAYAAWCEMRGVVFDRPWGGEETAVAHVAEGYLVLRPAAGTESYWLIPEHTP